MHQYQRIIIKSDISILSALLILLMTSVKAAAGCTDPTTLTSSTASITSYFDDDDKNLIVRGTGWFLSPWTMVTAEHVAEGMRLSRLSWKRVEIANDEIKQSTAMRILRVGGSNNEKLVVLEFTLPSVWRAKPTNKNATSCP